MSKNEKIIENKTCNCEELKIELENVKEELKNVNLELEQLKNKNAQYEESYKSLLIRYNRLYSILGNTIEQALNME